MFKPKIGMLVTWNKMMTNREEYGIILNIIKEKPYNGQVDVRWFGRDVITEKIPLSYLREVKDDGST